MACGFITIFRHGKPPHQCFFKRVDVTGGESLMGLRRPRVSIVDSHRSHGTKHPCTDTSYAVGLVPGFPLVAIDERDDPLGRKVSIERHRVMSRIQEHPLYLHKTVLRSLSIILFTLPGEVNARYRITSMSKLTRHV